jgi:hypothetical protein
MISSPWKLKSSKGEINTVLLKKNAMAFAKQKRATYFKSDLDKNKAEINKS